MSTIYDRAVRALQTVMPSLDGQGHPLAYYCGGPEMQCRHPACHVVSVLAEADLIWYGDVAETLAERNAKLRAENERLRAVVDAAREFVPDGEFPPLDAAIDALDGGP